MTTTRAQREFVLHLYAALPRYGLDTVPVYCRLMWRDLTDCAQRTADVWEPLEAARVLHVVEHCHAMGRSREFALTAEFADRMAAAGREGRADAKKLHTGTRNRAGAKKTKLRDEHGHEWGGDTGVALQKLASGEHRLNLAGAEALERVLKRQRDRAEERHAAAQERARGEGGQEARRAVWAAAEAREKAVGRLASYRYCLSTIKRQTVADEGDVVTIRNAYEVQEISGRLSFIGGGPQGVAKVAKALFYDLPGVHNYDISSSQTEGLRVLAEALREAGAAVDTAPLDTYLDGGGKDAAAERTGLPRELVKRVSHAVKFGAAIPKSSADGWRRMQRGSCEVMALVLRHYEYGEAANAALRALRETFGEIARMIEHMSDALLTTYWRAHRQAGGRGKGATMQNAAGIHFCPFDYEAGHERRAAGMAWFLQGLEAAYCHAITVMQDEYGYTVVANEHDGVITHGAVPEAAQRRARRRSGFHRATLKEKPFADAGDFARACGEGWREALDTFLPSPLTTPDTRRCQSSTKKDAPGRSGGTALTASQRHSSAASGRTAGRDGRPTKTTASSPPSDGRRQFGASTTGRTLWTHAAASLTWCARSTCARCRSPNYLCTSCK